MTCKKCGGELSTTGICPTCASAPAFYAGSSGGDSAPSRPAAPPMPSHARPVIGGRYQIVRTLGMGAVGVVYLARDLQSGENVALKVLRPAMRKNEEVLLRFRAEVEIAQHVDHPNIARVYSFEEGGGEPYIVMQYVEGQDLGQYNKSERPSLQRKLDLMKGIAAAVDAAHAAGVVHRDLKPANVRVAPDGTPFVLDFGVASRADDVSITRPGSFIGTPLYVSPEQAQGKKSDSRSDIYSLGAIFYELMTGRPPFIGDSAITIALKHIRETPFRPRSLASDIPTVVEDVILQCLEKDPSSRPQKAAEIVRAIERPIEQEVKAALSAAKTMAQEPGSGRLRDVSLFQYLRVITPMRRNFVLEIANNEEFGRYYFRGAHLVHAEAGNLRDEEVAYNLFYWTSGTYRLIETAEPPPKETVRIPWIPFVETYFRNVERLFHGAHGVVEGAFLIDLLDPKGSSVYRYVSDQRFEARIEARATMALPAFQKGRAHLRQNDLLKITKTYDDAAMLFCFAPGLRHYFYACAEAGTDIEAFYRWLKKEAEHRMIEALHDSMVDSDLKRTSRAGPIKVVVAESDEFLGNLIRIKLRAMGMDVYLVRDGVKALELIPQFQPDVIVLSADVRGLSGLEVCRLLTEGEEWNEARIVLLVRSESHVMSRELTPPGVTRTVPKPLVLADLMQLVRTEAEAKPRRRAIASATP